MKRKLSSILIGSTFLLAFAWESPLDKILFSYKKYLEERPQEKIYVHLDRPYYSSGETIWLKAYLVAGPLHEPSPLSHIIYIELIDQLQKVVQTTRLLADQSSAGGYVDEGRTVVESTIIIETLCCATAAACAGCRMTRSRPWRFASWTVFSTTT